MAKGTRGGGSKGGGSTGGKGPAGWPSTTGNPSGGGRDNAPSKKQAGTRTVFRSVNERGDGRTGRRPFLVAETRCTEPTCETPGAEWR